MFELPREVTLAPGNRQLQQPNLGHGLRIWWAIMADNSHSLICGYSWNSGARPFGRSSLSPRARIGHEIRAIGHQISRSAFYHALTCWQERVGIPVGLVPGGARDWLKRLSPFRRTCRDGGSLLGKVITRYFPSSVTSEGRFVGLFQASWCGGIFFCSACTGGALCCLVIYSILWMRTSATSEWLLMPRQTRGVPAHSRLPRTPRR